MAEPVWILESVVLAIHRRQLAEHGGAEGVQDRNLLLSALDRPQNLLASSEVPPDMAAMAAAYAFGITRNPPFVDGNKRMALVVCRTFLKVNGYDIEASQEDKYRTFLSLAEGSLSETELTHWIRVRLRETD